ncbi:hypothetical protein EDB89DRAFT_1937935 [Lactarius sanguifluus]|nr:hypothetical protein EDB89DRAFT_1937935 [Lactarius sanguifluus]
MRFPIDAAFLVLALANTLVDPVGAMPAHVPKRHLLKRATDGFHKTALRHSAGLAQDLRIALRGLGVASPARRSVTNSGNAPFCVPKSQSTPSTNTTTTPAATTGTSTPSSTAQSDWQLAESFSGNTFFSGWDFFTGSDPTNGIVQYQSSNLTSFTSDGNIIMRVDTTPQVTGNRPSVRIHSQFTFTGGLVIMDSVHMPTGCGTTGEIRHRRGRQLTTRTTRRRSTRTRAVSLPSSNVTALGISGSYQTGNQGCGVRAMRWDDSGIAVWFFARGSTPWGTPSAFWPASTCNPFEFFQDHSVIFDTTLCGDWASGVWTASGIPGQEQSCAQANWGCHNGTALSEAYWEVKGVQIYQSKS